MILRHGIFRCTCFREATRLGWLHSGRDDLREKASAEDVLQRCSSACGNRLSRDPGSCWWWQAQKRCARKSSEFLATPGLELVASFICGRRAGHAELGAAGRDRGGLGRVERSDVRFIEEVPTAAEPAIPSGDRVGAARLDSSLGRELTDAAGSALSVTMQSLERLLDERIAATSAGRSVDDRAEENAGDDTSGGSALAGKKILVVDDDLRNIFALTSVLEQHEMHVLHAETGRAGIHVLEQEKDVDPS